MKTTVTIKSPQGSIVTISVEHDEPMSLSTELEAIEEKADQAKKVIEAGRSLIDEIRSLGNIEEELLNTSLEKLDSYTEKLDSYTEKLDSYTENLDTSENSDEKPRCKWCGLSFDPTNKNEKYCSDICKHEARKDRDRIAKRVKTSKTPGPSKSGRAYEGKNCSRCGRFYVPTGPRQQFCKPDCKPLTPAEQAELDATLKEIESNKKKAVL